MAYLILSLKHTRKGDEFITLWRPNNAGYCFSKQSAGIYFDYERGYHDSEGNLPLEEDKADNLFISALYDNKRLLMLPNIPTVHRELGLKWTKGTLTKLK